MSPRQMIEKLSPGSQALIALLGAFSAGTAVALALAGWMELPAKVERQGDAIVLHSEQIADIKRTVRGDSAKIARIECVVVANAKGLDPLERCGL